MRLHTPRENALHATKQGKNGAACVAVFRILVSIILALSIMHLILTLGGAGL